MSSGWHVTNGPLSDPKRNRSPCVPRFYHFDRLPTETWRAPVVATYERGGLPPGRTMGRSGMAIPTLKSPTQTKVFRPNPRIYRSTFQEIYRYLLRAWTHV